jgi:FkbM family methyltransferase
MFNRWPEKISKAAEYFFTPFMYPGQFGKLTGLTLRNRPLVRELVHLTAHRKWFETVNPAVVIDVGGYIGAFALAMRTMLPETWIYTFEPLPDNFAKLQHNMAGDARFTAFQTALGDRQGTTDFWRCDFVASSSVLPMEDLHKEAFPATACSTKVTVPIARLDDHLAEMHLKRPVLMKLDVQGFEAQALAGAGETLQQVDYILTEVSHQPLYEGQVGFDELYALMKSHGFTYSGGFDSLISPVDGSILQSDALFIRKA